MRHSSKLLFFIVIIFPIFIYGTYKINRSDDDFEVAKNLELYHSVVKNIKKYYVYDVDLAGMINESIHEFLKKLDPYTNFYSEHTVENFDFMRTGSYAGVGIEVKKRNNRLFINHVKFGSPADEAGIKSGDYIEEIDGHKITSDNIDEILKMLKGTVGSTVNLKINRESDNNTDRDYTLTRKHIDINPVPFKSLFDNNIGYMKFSSFTQYSGSDFADSLLELNKTPLEGLIIDLRDNSGGFLNEAVKILDLFIDKDKILVTTRGRFQEDNKVYKTRKESLYPDLKIVVLVNNFSASASEIVSGALQDYDRAVILGERTFGKGLVQQTKKLGYNSMIKITIAKYYLPAGRCVQEIDYKKNKEKEKDYTQEKLYKTPNGRAFGEGRGVQPDVAVSDIYNSKFMRYLTEQFVIHDYITEYTSKHPKPNAESKIDFKEFTNFKKFAIKHFENANPFKKSLKDISKNKIYEEFNLQKDVLNIENTARQNLSKLLDENKEIIAQEIENKLYTRYFGKNKLPNFIIENDIMIKTAFSILKDTKRYKKILSIDE